MASIVDNGNWDEVATALVQKTEAMRSGPDFMSRVIAANAQAAEDAYFGPSGQSAGTRDATRGGSVARFFWWGFHVQVSHEDLGFALTAADPQGPFASMLRRVLPADYARWIDIIGPFVAGASGVIRGMDRGRGVYISMSWFAPGIFVPTSVP
jgi:hypothetical protein